MSWCFPPVPTSACMTPHSGCSNAINEIFDRSLEKVSRWPYLSVSFLLGGKTQGRKPRLCKHRLSVKLMRLRSLSAGQRTGQRSGAAVHTSSPSCQVIKTWLLNPKQGSGTLRFIPSYVFIWWGCSPQLACCQSNLGISRLCFLVRWVGWEEHLLAPSHVSQPSHELLCCQGSSNLGTSTQGSRLLWSRWKGDNCCIFCLQPLLKKSVAMCVGGGGWDQKVAFKSWSCSVLIYLCQGKSEGTSENWGLNT